MTVFEHDDYRDFLRSFLNSLPKKGHGEVNRIANHLRVHPTLVSQVLNGTRDFSIEQAHKLSRYLGLQNLECDYFILLLQKERAGTADLKNYFNEKIEEIKKVSLKVAHRITEHRNLSEPDKSIFYSNWLYIAVWLQTSVENGQTVDQISRRLSITRASTMDCLTFLRSAQLCEEKDGLYKMLSPHIHLKFGSNFLDRHHTNWRVKALQRTHDLKDDELMFTSPFSVSVKDFAKLREMFMKVIRETSTVIKDSSAEDIACMNIDLFWIKG